MKLDINYDYYELLKPLIGYHGFNNLDEIYDFIESKAQEKGLDLNIDIEDGLKADQNLLSGKPFNTKSLLALFYQSLKVFSSEYLDFFGGKLPFIITKDFNTLVERLSNELNLTDRQKDELRGVIVNFSANRWVEKKFRSYGHTKKELDIAFNELPKEMEADFEHLINKYRKKYKSTEIYIHLLGLQTKFNENLKEILIEGIKKDLSKMERFPPDLLELPTSRPTSPSYDLLLMSLSKIVINDKGFYIPSMVKILNSLKTDHPESLGDFEINSESVRIKLSKMRNTPK